MSASSVLLSALVALRALPGASEILSFTESIVRRIDGVKSVELIQSNVAEEESVQGLLSLSQQRDKREIPIMYKRQIFGTLLLEVARDVPPEVLGDVVNFANMVALELHGRQTSAALQASLAEQTTRGQKLSVMTSLAVKAAGIGIWEYIPESDELSWSPAMLQIYGISEDDLTGYYTDWSDRLHPEDRDQAEAELSISAKAEVPFETRFRIVRPSGEVRHVSAYATIHKDVDSSRSTWIGVNIDVTEQERLIKGLREAKDMAMEANHAKSFFLANVSHELRTPLNAIIGMSEALASGFMGALQAKQQEYINDIHQSGQLLHALVNDLLDTTSLELNKRNLHFEQIDLSELVTICVHSLNAVDRNFQNKFQLDIEEGARELVADKRAVQQILLNVLSNANKFTDHGDKITLSARRENNVALLSVRDTGHGMSQEFLELAAAPFSRENSNPHVTQPGWGIGLSIVKSLAELHGGTINIQSKTGQGTEVLVQIPFR